METKQNNIEQYGKIPPQAVDVEEGLLGSLILDCELLNTVSNIISVDSFYRNEHKIIFKSISELINSGKNVDLVVLSRYLNDHDLLEKIGGVIFLTKIVNNSSYNSDVELYAKIITEKFAAREIIRICTELSNKAFLGEIDIEELICDFQQSSLKIENHFDAVDAGTSTKEVAKETLNEIYSDIEKTNKGEPSGIDTGFYDLNRMTGGFKPATLIIVAARPSVGKTTLALHFAITAAKKHKWVVFFSFEMTKTQLFKIIISGESDVDRTNIRDGKLTNEELRQINLTVGDIENLPIIWNTRRINVEQMKSIVRKNKRLGRCDLVIVDYLGLMKPTDSKVVREQQVSHISSELKSITTDFEIPVIALNQLNRLAATEIPQLHHLRESGAIEQDADNVIFPYKEIDTNMNEISYSLIIAKARNGSTGRFEVWHNEQMTKFGNKGNDIEPINYQMYSPNSNFGEELF